MKQFIGITGTTCVGKSDIAVMLAQKLHCEIISADSMQIYCGMDIGTAKIKPSEMGGVAHYMLDIVQPNQDFSAFDFAERASQLIENAQTPPIVVGGTGFYFDSLLYPPEFGGTDKQLRENLKRQLDVYGLQYLQEKLKESDRDAYNSIDIKNPVRVFRALEIVQSGEKRSEGRGKNREPRFQCKLFVLQLDRTSLVQEVENLVSKFGYCDTSAFSAIGYKEIISYLKGETTLSEAINQIKINTRHYAKRQQTYFKKMNVCRFIDVGKLSKEQVVQEIIQTLQ